MAHTEQSFTPTPDWVLSLKKSKGLSPLGYMTYHLLLMRASSSEGGATRISQEDMADTLDVHTDTIGRIINRELKPLGLVSVQAERYGTNNSLRRNVYTVHTEPAEGFTGPLSSDNSAGGE